MNKVILSGQVVRKISKHSIFKDKNGEVLKSQLLVNNSKGQSYIQITLFNELAQDYANAVKEKDFIKVEGELRTSSWLDKNNQKQYSLDIIGQSFSILERKVIEYENVETDKYFVNDENRISNQKNEALFAADINESQNVQKIDDDGFEDLDDFFNKNIFIDEDEEEIEKETQTKI